MTDRLLTADQLAERWQVPKSQVYALTRRGAIPTVKLGKYYRYRLDAIEGFERCEIREADYAGHRRGRAAGERPRRWPTGAVTSHEHPPA